MPNEDLHTLSYADRKKALLAEGAHYRSLITRSKQVVHTNLSVDVIAHNAVTHITSAAYGAVNNLFSVEGIRGGSIQKLLPLLLTAYTAVSKRSLLKPILKGTMVVAGLGAVAVLVFRNKKSKKNASQPVAR